ncbi:putative 60S ribosomal protein L28 [Apostichopus japonicus]|uniref:Large ribosomal subunit protein eL28 n=1 Tax=Stichopus japonicus TaxID=307972 RepID=A0A2G8JK96_STIJA|nr:putative 60S ribosomal protein L28 [Apostichopus japonicus]
MIPVTASFVLSDIDFIKKDCFKSNRKTEPNNLKNRPTYRGSGLIHKKTVGVIPAPDNKGVMLVMKRKKGQNRPAKMYNKVTFKKGWRSNLKGIANSVNGYRSDLKMAALRRASAIHMSQKRSSIVKKKRTPRPKTT